MNLNGGYAMIKFNSTQEELGIAYRSKKPVLFYDENQRSHWAVIEEKATQSVDEETQELITLYEYSYRLLDEESGGSNLIDDIVDLKGNKRFVKGEGIAYTEDVVGMTAKSTKWTLNGNNLILEFAGTFSQDVTGQTQLATYEIPEWISNKITVLEEVSGMGIVSPLSYNVATTEKSLDVKVMLLKLQNYLSLALIDNLSVSIFNGVPASFRFICHLIIDSE